MIRTLRSEWTKLRTMPATAWLLLATVGCSVVLSAMVTAAISAEECRAPCMEDITRLALIGVKFGQIPIIVLAVLAISAEYSTGTIYATLMACPRRWSVMTSKLAITTATALAAGAVAVAGSLLVGRLLLPGNGFTPANGYALISPHDDLTLRAAIGSVLYLGLIALLSGGIATIVRDTATAIATMLALLFLAPMIAMVISDPRWQHWLNRFAPMEAGLTIQHTINLDKLQIGAWTGLGLLGLYAVAATVIGGALLDRRDA